MYREAHGGDCCGISHISNFGSVTERTLKELDDILHLYDGRTDDDYEDDISRPWSHLFEVVLTDNQAKTWAKPLKERGFRKVTRFRNSNSGNSLTVFHFVSGNGTRRAGKRSYTW